MMEAIIGFAIALITAFIYGKSQGKKQYTEEKLESMEKAKDVEKEVAKMGDDKLRDVASKWVRNKDR